MAFKRLLVLLFVQRAQVGSASRVTRRLSVINAAARATTCRPSSSNGSCLRRPDRARRRHVHRERHVRASGNNMLYINKDITIRALNPGRAVLDGQNAKRVIYVASGAVALEGLSITRGRTSGDGGGVYITGSSTSVTFTNCNIHNNHASDDGGGVAIIRGTGTFADCNIHNNQASDTGGGLYLQGAYGGENVVGMFINCNIYQNLASTTNGEVVACTSKDPIVRATFTNCDIYSNTTANQGGGVRIHGGTVTFTNCNIYSNTVTNGNSPGGGVYIAGGSVLGR